MFVNVNHAQIRSCDQPIHINKDTFFCSRKYREPLVRLELTTDRHPCTSQTSYHVTAPRRWGLILCCFKFQFVYNNAITQHVLESNTTSIMYILHMHFTLTICDGWCVLICNKGLFYVAPWKCCAVYPIQAKSSWLKWALIWKCLPFMRSHVIPLLFHSAISFSWCLCYLEYNIKQHYCERFHISVNRWTKMRISSFPTLH